jgi:hypothetical protein
MKANHHCTHEARTARFNLPVCRRSAFRRLLKPLLAPPTRLHRYRNLSTKMLENALDELDHKPCT